MTARDRNALSEAAIAAGWPYQVEVPARRNQTLAEWSALLIAMMGVVNEAGGKIRSRGKNRGTIIFCFSRDADAWEFQKLFGGDAFTVVASFRRDELGRATNEIAAYREVRKEAG
ncbi:hypothetical protein [Terrarubrum flagellatum]|uniref:hypothetical protein n=1 Tax=Terrirubrum flagellatum TaxID=2895980 RepID=UPI0031451589